MRLTITSILIFFMATCPLWCAPAEAHHRHQGFHDPAERAGGTAPIPVNDDHCVCNGALKPAVSDVSQSDPSLQRTPFHPDLLARLLALDLSAGTLLPPPTSLDPGDRPDAPDPCPGDDARSPCLLQSFRC